LTKHTIPFLAANPLRTDRLALDREARAIQTALERGGYRDQFELVIRWGSRWNVSRRAPMCGLTSGSKPGVDRPSSGAESGDATRSTSSAAAGVLAAAQRYDRDGDSRMH
jgi:hypothetical protein